MAPLDLAAAWAMPRGPRDHLSTTSYSKATCSGSFSLNHSSSRSGLANTLISTRQGWLVSIPGDPEMRFQALPDSGLPLRSMDYIVERTGETQAICSYWLRGTRLSRPSVA